MTKLLLEERRHTHDILVTFANTGCEHADTLRFVNDCDREWDFNVVWLEAVVTHGSRVGIRHKIVTYATASRNGEPFEEYIKKYGIPNRVNPNCTGRLKTEVIESFARSKGFFRGKKLNYDTAIGIRADEIDRMSVNREANRFIYPLVNLGWTKPKIVEYMKQFPWDLAIPEHLGNCTWCWKKSNRKLLTIAQDYPEVFNFPAKMEKEYSHVKADAASGYEGKRNFFRGNLTVADIKELAAKGDFKRFDDPTLDTQITLTSTNDFDPDMDHNTGCGDSCEVYPTDGS
jgi:hypothetical protein